MKRLLSVLLITVILTSALYLYYLKNNKDYDLFPQVFRYSTPDEEKITEEKTTEPGVIKGDQVKIMTYNIRHGRGLDGKYDLQRIADIIHKSEAHIIGLNEVDHLMSRTRFQNQVKIIAEELGMYYIFGPALRSGIGSYGNAILSRFPLQSTRNHILPAKEGNEKRGLLEAKVMLPDWGPVYIFSTHLSLDPFEREEQLSWVDSYLEELKLPFILMGDFNSLPENSLNLKPVFKGIESYPADQPREEIDLFFSNLNFKLIDSYAIKSQASDHLPVVMEIERT